MTMNIRKNPSGTSTDYEGAVKSLRGNRKRVTETTNMVMPPKTGERDYGKEISPRSS